MWRVIFVLTVLTATCEPYVKKHKSTASKNQRIIKVQGPPHFNHFHGHQKPFRKRPYGQPLGEEFIRPNHPPPMPPFFNGPSTNHIKHPRPPPHVFHKSPSYGLGFPYKTSLSYRPSLSKDKFHNKGVSSLPIRTVVSSSSSTSSGSVSGFSSGSASGSSSISSSTNYSPQHLPKFTTSSFVSSPPVSHIISSDDNNGPIREIPAPNLAPKPHDISFQGVVGDISGIGGVSGISAVSGIGLTSVNLHGVGGIGGVGDVGIGGISGVGNIHGVSDINVGGGIHGINDIGGRGGILGVNGVAEISNVASVGDATHLESDSLLNSVAKKPNGVNLDAIVKDPGVDVHPYIQESGGDLHHGKEHTVEIANFDEGSSIDVTNLIKNAAGTSGHHSGYEVTEHHNHLPSNDQIIKGHDGTKLYYAPDPDPSLPVQKVPPTNDPHSTPSNGHEHVNSVFLQPVPQFPYIQNGGLSPQELFHLMHGYPAVISQPVVAFVSQPQPPQVVLSNGGSNYFQQGSGAYEEQYSHSHPQSHSNDGQEENDINQYLQRPEIHNLIHNSAESHHEHEVIGGSHSSIVSQSVSSPQNHQGYTHPVSVKDGDSSLERPNGVSFHTSNINDNYQYEPEASESNSRNSLTVIRQTDEGALSSETVKELLLEDSAANDLNQRDSASTVPTVLQLKNIPEVPFYASLPSKKAAEALASLQAAGSVASDYMSKIKVSRGDQDPEEENTRSRSGRLNNEEERYTGETHLLGIEKTVVDIQKSVPLYETSITSKNLLKNDENEEQSTDFESGLSSEDADEPDYSILDFKEDHSSKTFGKRIRPK